MEVVAENRTVRKIKCDSKITINFKLNICHGTALMLRNVQWILANQSISKQLLGRPPLEKPSQLTKNILGAVADCFHGTYYLASINTENDGVRIARAYSTV